MQAWADSIGVLCNGANVNGRLGCLCHSGTAPTPTRIEKMSALYLVSIGRATAEQQKLAYRFHLELLQQREAASKKPKKQTKEDDRNAAIYLMLRYVPSEDDMSEEELREYKPMSRAQACKLFAEGHDLEFSTVKREYRRWENETTPEQKERAASRAASAMLNIFSE